MRRTIRTLLPIERAAIGELLAFVEVLLESNRNRPSRKVQAFAAMICERVANIIRGEVGPRVMRQADVRAFARQWKVHERAAFNPPAPPPRRKKAR